MTKKLFVMKAESYSGQDLFWPDYVMSEKLDGQRCLWDGGVSIGLPVTAVPWANTQKDKREFIATGLWSANGKAIMCPPSFTESLPRGQCFDGELYIARGKFHELRSIVSTDEPDGQRWKAVKYMIFDAPTATAMFQNRTIAEPNMKKALIGCYLWWNSRGMNETTTTSPCFIDRYHAWTGWSGFASHIDVLQQWAVNNYASVVAKAKLVTDPYYCRKTSYQSVADGLGMPLDWVKHHADPNETVAGEGVMLRHIYSPWTPERSKHMYKVKPTNDTEGVVVGYNAGLGRHAGRLGSLRLKYNSIEFDLGGGFDDVQRNENLYPIGTTITFTYRTLSPGGVPLEARFLRVRTPE